MGFDSAGFEVGERPVHSPRQRAGRKPVSDEAAVDDNAPARRRAAQRPFQFFVSPPCETAELSAGEPADDRLWERLR